MLNIHQQPEGLPASEPSICTAKPSSFQAPRNTHQLPEGLALLGIVLAEELGPLHEVALDEAGMHLWPAEQVASILRRGGAPFPQNPPHLRLVELGAVVLSRQVVPPGFIPFLTCPMCTPSGSTSARTASVKPARAYLLAEKADMYLTGTCVEEGQDGACKGFMAMRLEQR